MAKKARAGSQDALMADIFGTLNDDGEPETGENDAGGSKKVSNEALEAKINALQGDLDRVTRTNTALMANPGSFSVQNHGPDPKKAPEIDVKGLPDPISDPEGYHTEVTRRISAAVQGDLTRQREADQAQQAQQQQQGMRTEALWNEFETAYPELARHPDMAKMVAEAVAMKAQAKGMDVQRYMFGASEQYIADVATEMKKRFGRAIEVMNKEADGGEEEETEVTPENARGMFRTQGIMGGVAGSTGKEKASPAPKDDLVTDLHKAQRAMGLI